MSDHHSRHLALYAVHSPPPSLIHFYILIDPVSILCIDIDGMRIVTFVPLYSPTEYCFQFVILNGDVISAILRIRIYIFQTILFATCHMTTTKTTNSP